LTNFLKDLEEKVKVVEVSEVDKMEEEDQINVIIVMSRDITLEIFLFRDVLGVPTIEKTPMPPRIVLSLL
jgi:hypothetical protein